MEKCRFWKISKTPFCTDFTLINVNNLRDDIDITKRELMKEKLDRQLTGQSSTPFMRVTSNDNHSLPNSNKRGVTFDAMETLERNSDCIDKLTSLVIKPYAPHAILVVISHLVKKVPLQELLSATEFSVRLV